jgi:hypothetical protein
MVTENQEPTQEPTQAPLPDLDVPSTDEFTGTGEVSDVVDVQAPSAPDTTSDPSVEPRPAPETAPTPEPAPAPPQGPSQQEVMQLQRQAAEYEQLRMRAALQQESNKYKQQLENQGYMPEQADQAAQQYMQSRQAQSSLMKKAEDYGQHLSGKMAAAEHFAQQYKLGMDDLPVLRQAESPEIMESLAKGIAERRGIDDELARLRQAQVPAQQFDNSQGMPDVAANDSGWIDRYNSGDRSTQAVAAARKAAGFS